MMFVATPAEMIVAAQLVEFPEENRVGKQASDCVGYQPTLARRWDMRPQLAM